MGDIPGHISRLIETRHTVVTYASSGGPHHATTHFDDTFILCAEVKEAIRPRHTDTGWKMHEFKGPAMPISSPHSGPSYISKMPLYA